MSQDKIAFVYFAKPVGLEDRIKIGYARQPKRRVIDLAAWSPWPIELVGTVPGTYQDEQFLHRCFAGQHSHREWFFMSPELADVIAKILDAGKVRIEHPALVPRSMRLAGNPYTKTTRPTSHRKIAP